MSTLAIEFPILSGTLLVCCLQRGAAPTARGFAGDEPCTKSTHRGPGIHRRSILGVPRHEAKCDLFVSRAARFYRRGRRWISLDRPTFHSPGGLRKARNGY